MAVLSKLPDEVQRLDGCLVFFRDNSMYGNIFLIRGESTINILLKIVCRQYLTQKEKKEKKEQNEKNFSLYSFNADKRP